MSVTTEEITQPFKQLALLRANTLSKKISTLHVSTQITKGKFLISCLLSRLIRETKTSYQRSQDNYRVSVILESTEKH